MKKNTIQYFILLILLLSFMACKKEPEEKEAPITCGKIKIKFSHVVENEPIVLNSFQYINEAGNQYKIDELMYFISDVKLYKHNSSPVNINNWTAIHYVDVQMPETLEWAVYDTITKGKIDSISFTFGLSAQRNQSFLFVNPPESNMFWPDILGGGYHYLMINGKWIDGNQEQIPYNFHLGIGQIYSDTVTYNTNSITQYVQNYFTVTLPTPDLEIITSQTTTLKLQMDVSSWFKTPYVWDFNYWGGNVMQYQRALNVIKENGFDVFSVVE